MGGTIGGRARLGMIGDLSSSAPREGGGVRGGTSPPRFLGQKPRESLSAIFSWTGGRANVVERERWIYHRVEKSLVVNRGRCP